MWILIKKTHSGPAGFFESGRKFDLPEATIEQLPKKYYKETCPPWEEQTDKKLIARNKAEAEFLRLQQTANDLRLRLEEIINTITALAEQAKAADVASKSAACALEETIKEHVALDMKKSRSKNEDKKLSGLQKKIDSLLPACERPRLESLKASGQLQAAIAQADLYHFDHEAAQAQANAAKAKFDELAPEPETKEDGTGNQQTDAADQAQSESKEPESEKDDTENQQTDPADQAQSEPAAAGDGNAEGQAASSAETGDPVQNQVD